MEKQNILNYPLFKESFSSRTDSLPGGWFVERNHDMPQVPGIRCGEKCIELLSAGNKFLPLIPDAANCHVRFKAGINFAVAEHFGILVSFRYDTFTGRGQAIRIAASEAAGTFAIEYGNMQNNVFTPEKSKQFKIDLNIFNEIFEIELKILENDLSVKVAGTRWLPPQREDALVTTTARSARTRWLPPQREDALVTTTARGRAGYHRSAETCARFKIRKGSGKIALSRQHFFDVLKIHSFEIQGEKPISLKKDVRFTVPLPDCHTYYPIYCDVTLTDYGNCMDAALSFHGGVIDTPLGEGNYHGLRADILERPYLKLLTEDKVEKHVMHDKTMVLIPPGRTPKYLYTIIYEKPQWPFCRTIRFMKPAGKFDLAVGFDEYQQNSLPNMELRPAETVFTEEGRVLYSGLGITKGENTKIEFLSQENKAILQKLPKTDPRYERAVRFAKENHYFLEKESPQFKIRLSSSSSLPALYKVVLEDAFLRPVRTLKCKLALKEETLGVSRIQVAELSVEALKGLKCGVWHLRVCSTDPSVPAVEDYCAFEIMSAEHDAPSAPEISKLPFLYNARTETRGLMTDAFDPWIGASVDEGHYITCSVMLPAAYRKYNMADTIHAYQRKNFSWVGDRTLDDWSVEHNLDVLKKSDYANIQDNDDRINLSWSWMYKGRLLQHVIDFLKKVKDKHFKLSSLEKLVCSGETMPSEEFHYFVETYWEEWLDYMNERTEKWVCSELKRLRKLNPKLQFAQYGPFHIYAGRMKGPEAARWICNEKLTPELNAFWQFEDYPFSCGYPLERGVYTLTSCLMLHPGSRIYPEIYTASGKLKQGCPDGAVYYAHPPFGARDRRKMHLEKCFIQQMANFAYATGHLEKDGFHFWEHPGFQAMRFNRDWYSVLLHFWPTILEHPASRPLRSAAYISSEDSRRTNRKTFFDDFNILRITATEDVPAVYETVSQHGLCAGFQAFDTDLEQLDASQVDTLVLPPTRGMKKRVLKQIRRLHAQGVNLVSFENVEGLEELFGVKDTGVMKKISLVKAIGDFCKGMTEYCDNEHCEGSYRADGAKILLSAEIPVLTVKQNGKASAAFFNVPPHMVKPDTLHERLSYGKSNISPLMEKAMTDLMLSFSRSGISVTGGHLIACRTKDNGTMVFVSNPNQDHNLTVEITIQKQNGMDGTPEVNRDYLILREDKHSRTFRVFLPPKELISMFFR